MFYDLIIVPVNVAMVKRCDCSRVFYRIANLTNRTETCKETPMTISFVNKIGGFKPAVLLKQANRYRFSCVKFENLQMFLKMVRAGH